MRVLVTGANGFLGKNLQLHLAERENVEIVTFTRDDDAARLPLLLTTVDFVFHLAGVNRPNDIAEFTTGNVNLTQTLADALCHVSDAIGKKIPVIFTSSTQAAQANSYGASKRQAEESLLAIARSHQIPVHIYRLPNVFGKWSKPNYNSVVATFCHNIARDLSIQIHDPAAEVTLVYVDDVIESFIQLLEGANVPAERDGLTFVTPQYTTTVGELAHQIQTFRSSRDSLIIDRVGTGLIRALYATYVSYLPVELFTYTVPKYGDPRGVFVEMLKTQDSGQFSFFTAHSGITRGGHYHHSKTEKFLVIAGQARFKFRHMQTGQEHELITCGENPEIVETIPGWTHDITNIGPTEMVVMLWANELFDRTRPDTFTCPL